MKSELFLISIILVVLIVAFYQNYFKPKEETIYVAFIGPMSEPGKAT